MAFQRKKPAAVGVKAPYPGFIEPELATSIDRVPSGERWIHEIKFDGYSPASINLKGRGFCDSLWSQRERRRQSWLPRRFR
jgi:hypothetical protein